MKVVRIALGVVAIGLALCGPMASEAATRARFNAETVLNDPPARISAGISHTCQVNEDGTVRCWGANTFGQLGNGTRTTERTIVPVLVSGLQTAAAVTAGDNFTCALLFDGTVRCWGTNERGQLGNGATGLSLVPVAVSGITTAVAVHSGGLNTCALLANGTVRCWGNTVTGDGTIGDRLTPITVLASSGTPLTNVISIAVGTFHSCALMGTGEVRCWGQNFFGELGRGSVGGTFSLPAPVTISPNTPLTNVVAIKAGTSTTCAQIANGTARCWGRNDNGQLGTGTTVAQSAIPVSVGGIGQVTGIATGGNHTCVLQASGNILCAGLNNRGQLGDGTLTTRRSPVFVGISPINQTPLNAVAMATGGHHTCALLADGSAKCWGDNSFGQLGISNTALLNLAPTPVLGGPGTFTARDVAAGSNHTCAVRANGAVVCWGSNGSGQLGVGDTANRISPTAVLGDAGNPGPAVAVAAGDAHSCALVVNGTVRCWGDNGFGQLGLGDTQDRLAPTTVPGLLSVVGIAAGGALGSAHTCAVISDGTVRCWGSNGSGQLGTGNTLSSTVPVAVPGLTNVVAIAAGEFHTCALLASGISFCWGFNGSGRLGEGTQTTRLSPIIVGLSNMVSIAGGSSHTCALRSDGTPACWGANVAGQLGIGSTVARSVPTLLSLPNAIAIAGGLSHSCAVVSAGGGILSGDIRCWGDNSVGQLGNASTTSSLVPDVVKNVRTIGGLGGSFTIATPLGRAVGITTGRRHSCALLATGALYCWGDNTSGQLGVNSTTSFFTQPISVPSFALNIDPSVSLNDRDRSSAVTVLANCDEGRRLYLAVTLKQDTAVGHGIGAGKCTGAMKRYPVTVPVWGRGLFIEGAGQVSAGAVISERGSIVDIEQWTRAVQVQRAR
jgi:alpha-tubulin suppressor-like RCC1 family protein